MITVINASAVVTLLEQRTVLVVLRPYLALRTVITQLLLMDKINFLLGVFTGEEVNLPTRVIPAA